MHTSLTYLVLGSLTFSLSACSLATVKQPDFPPAEVSNQLCYPLNGSDTAQRPQQFAADFALSGYQANGELDRRFGDNGTATVDFGDTREAASALVPQGDGIVAAGYASSEAVALARWQSNGNLDPSFGEEGKVLTPLYPADDPPTNWGDRLNEQVNMISTPDGFWVIAERPQPGTAERPGFVRQTVVLLRYTRDGQLDRRFGEGGRVITRLDGKASIYDVARQPDGKLVAVGRLDPGLAPNPNVLLVLRYLPDGILEKRCIVTLDQHHEEVATAIAIAPNGHLWIGGYWRPQWGLNSPLQNEPPIWLLAQLDAEGSLVTDFADNGYLQGDRAERETAIESIHIEADNSLLLASPSALLGEYRPDANQITPLAPNDSQIAASYLYPLATIWDEDSMLALGGGTYGTVNDCPHLARYTLDGSLDRRFGDNGFVPLTPDLNQSHAIATQGETIWVGGNTVEQ